MRDLLRHCPSVVLGFLLAAGGAQLFAQAGGAIKVIKVGSQNVGSASSAGVLVNRTLYVAGQDGRNSSGEVPKDFQKEVRRSLDHVQGVLRAAGMDFGNVVWMNIYLTDISNMDGMNKVYWKMIGADSACPHRAGGSKLAERRKYRNQLYRREQCRASSSDPSDGMATGTAHRSCRNRSRRRSLHVGPGRRRSTHGESSARIMPEKSSRPSITLLRWLRLPT